MDAISGKVLPFQGLNPLVLLRPKICIHQILNTMDIGLSSLISSLANAMFGTGAVIAQNQYNSPISQLRRLRKAGLPQAYMYQGKVNQQTQVPQLSLEPTLGQAKKLELSQQNEMNQANIKKIAEEILSIQQDIERKKTDNERNQRKLNWEKSLEWSMGKDGFPVGTANDINLFEIDKAQKRASLFIDQNEGRLREIMKNVENTLFDENVQVNLRRQALEKVKKQVALLISQDKVLGQLYNIREIQETLNKSLSDAIDSKSELTKGIVWALMQIMGKLSIR